jgi:hypothetical protein
MGIELTLCLLGKKNGPDEQAREESHFGEHRCFSRSGQNTRLRRVGLDTCVLKQPLLCNGPYSKDQCGVAKGKLWRFHVFCHNMPSYLSYVFMTLGAVFASFS